METLKLEHLKGYLDCKTLVFSKHGAIYRLNTFSDMKGKGIENRSIDAVLSDEMKPILFPLDMLIKEVDVNGEKIKPIVSIIKELSPYYLNECSFESGFDSGLYWVNAIRKNSYVLDSISFDGNIFQKYVVDGYGEWDFETINSQSAALELLNKYHFDWKYNLIEKGLAIPVTETFNPYK